MKLLQSGFLKQLRLAGANYKLEDFRLICQEVKICQKKQQNFREKK